MSKSLRDITPLVLTFNEEMNLERTLRGLQWAQTVVILDSGSTDRTRAIAGGFPNVVWRERPFDCHSAQWEFGIRKTGITSRFVLALDADMVLDDDCVSELETFLESGAEVGVLRFRYAINGSPLLGSIYPDQVRIFPVDSVVVDQAGHTQRFTCSGKQYRFRKAVLHDDRKDFSRWLSAQEKYARLECDRILRAREAGLKDRLRRAGVMPALAGLLAFFRSGGPLCGRASLRYAAERSLFECMLLIELLNHREIQKQSD